MTGRGFALAPGRSAADSATSAGASCRDAEIAQALEAAEPRELLDARGGIVRPEGGAEAGDRLAGDRLVEPERRRQRQRVQRAVRRAVAAAERLGECVAEREHRAAERGAGMTGALEELRACLRVVGPPDHAGEPFADQLCARESIGVGLGLSARGRRAPRRSVRARSATCRPSRVPAARASAAARRRSRAGWHRRRRRASGGPGRGRRRRTSTPPRSTSSAPRRAAARSRPTPPCPCRSHCRRRSRRSCRRRPEPRSGATAPPPSDPLQSKTSRQRGLATTSGRSPASAGSSRDAPADDHPASSARANSTNASAARVGVRPEARASEISRRASSPSTLAAVSEPPASSGSTAEREMKVTP